MTSTRKPRPAFPAKGPAPTLATAVAAGTKIILSPMFVAATVAAMATSPEAVARSEWNVSNRGVQENPRNRCGGNDLWPRYPTRGQWLRIRASQLREWTKMAKGLDAEALANLTEDPGHALSMAATAIMVARTYEAA